MHTIGYGLNVYKSQLKILNNSKMLFILHLYNEIQEKTIILPLFPIYGLWHIQVMTIYVMTSSCDKMSEGESLLNHSHLRFI